MDFDKLRIICKDAFLVMDNLAFFPKRMDSGALGLSIVDVNNTNKKMDYTIVNNELIMLGSSLSEANSYKAMLYTNINKDLIVREVYKKFMLDGLEYKGYRARIEFDRDDNIFTGTVVGIKDCICFHGHSIEELEESFHQSIDDYLEMCKDIGFKPNQPSKE